MLCLGAVLRCEKATPEELGVVYQTMLEISTKRSYLAVAAIQFLVDYLPKISPDDFAEHVWPKLTAVNAWLGKEAKIEAFWLLLEISTVFSKLPPKAYVQEHFHRKKLLSEKLPGELADILMVSVKIFLH